MSNILLAVGLVLMLSLTANGLSFDLSGKYLNLFSASKTLLHEEYSQDLNRFRLVIRSQISEKLSADIQYDIEAYLGSWLKTATFTAFKNYRPPTKYDLISPLLDSDNLYLRQKLYRCNLNYSLPDGDIKIGRQKIPWGVARVWNPTDPFNPIDFANIEREERTGVDAVSLDLPLSELAGLNLVYVEGMNSDSVGARLRANQGGADYSCSAAKLGDNYWLGFDLAGQVCGAGVRSEIAFTKARTEADYLRLVLSYDYNFTNSMYFLAEFYYNGQGKNDTADYQWNRLFSGEISNLARYYGFVGVTYDISPLLKGGLYFIYNIDDASRYANPFMEYSMAENVLFAIGSHIMGGKTGSEFGDFSNIYYTQIKCYL